MGNKYGAYNADGSLQQEADECILTGRYVDPDNSVREHVKDTNVFYRVHQDAYENVTSHQRGQWQANGRKLAAEQAVAQTPADMIAPPESPLTTSVFEAPSLPDAASGKKKGGA